MINLMETQLEIIKKASISIEKRKYLEAKQSLLDYIKKNQDVEIDKEFYFTLYLVSEKLKEIQNCKKYLEKCLEKDSSNYVILNNLGNIFFREGNVEKAEKLYKQSYQIKKDYLLAVINIAILYQNIGMLDESKKFYLKAIELSPKQLSLYYNLSRIDKNFIDKQKIDFLSNLMKNEKISLSEMSWGFFLLAEYERKKKNFSKEFEYLTKGHTKAFDSNLKANLLTLNYWQNIIPKNYNKFSFKNIDNKNKFINFKPIFIIGLPRSGSTIVDAMLASSSGALNSLGESSIFNGIIASNFSKNQDQNNQLDFNNIINKISNIFFERNYDIKNYSFIDKSLENFFYIDVILKIFPKAKFINTFRNLEDNILAIFKASLGKLSWTHKLDDVLKYINNYIKIIDYYNQKYPEKILRVDLEDLTERPEDLSKKIYLFCDLKWTNDILKFQNRKDLLISTASNIQIRENIHQYNFEKYKPYKEFLKNFTTKYSWIN